MHRINEFLYGHGVRNKLLNVAECNFTAGYDFLMNLKTIATDISIVNYRCIMVQNIQKKKQKRVRERDRKNSLINNADFSHIVSNNTSHKKKEATGSAGGSFEFLFSLALCDGFRARRTGVRVLK